MTFGDALRWALVGGRVDRLRFSITTLGAALSAFILLTAAVVVAIPDGASYRVQVLNDAGLHGGTAAALGLLSLPALVLTALGARVGSPRRDRRLAAFRLVGMTPAEARRVVSTETGLAAVAGSVLALVVFLLARVVFDHPASFVVVDYGPDGPVRQVVQSPGPALPFDVTPRWWAAALALLVVPVSAVVLSRLALRRVSLTPFGVVRRNRRRPPAVVPALALVTATILFAAWPSVLERLQSGSGRGWWELPPLVLTVVILVSLLVGTASTAHLIGRILASRARSTTVLIAARRLVADPWSASRATASILLAVLVGTGAAVFTVEANLMRSDTQFFEDTYHVIAAVVGVAMALAAAGLLVIQLETMMLRRQSLATLAAVGVPRSVLVRAHLLEAVLPVVPMVLVAASVGVAAMRGYTGGGRMEVADDPSGNVALGTHFISVPIPWMDLSLFAGGAVLAVLATSLLGAATMSASLQPRELRTAS